jgi:putative death-receptor fusion protein DUF2428
MREMILGMRNAEEGKELQLQDIFAAIGNLAFVQLSTLRHRGALTTVSQTFLTCCQLSPRLETNCDSLLKAWYQVCNIPKKMQNNTTDLSQGGGKVHFDTGIDDQEVSRNTIDHNWHLISKFS